MNLNQSNGKFTEPLVKPLSAKEVTEETEARVSRIQEEFIRGFELLRKYPKSVSFFGSSLFKEDNEHYQTARRLAGRFAKLGYAVITGAGGGIMEAANRGAFEAGGQSVGLNIKLPENQSLNKYLTDSTEFRYFFSRKTVLSFAAEAYLFFPGGFGTLDEFFEILELLHTKKIFPVPLILVGSDYWNKLDDFIRQEVFKRHRAIEEKDMTIYQIVDDEETVIKLVTELPDTAGLSRNIGR
ncbi:MAG: hypothetical protein UW71_C0007G0009 [Parcubacteria group bacterium GW2011_GWB1_44_7]|nr:MAG: hypothetical protein UW71_C0007G0009 [Parcubacteria group bacterium GW2011_GWB1_44_7]